MGIPPQPEPVTAWLSLILNVEKVSEALSLILLSLCLILRLILHNVYLPPQVIIISNQTLQLVPLSKRRLQHLTAGVLQRFTACWASDPADSLSPYAKQTVTSCTSDMWFHLTYLCLLVESTLIGNFGNTFFLVYLWWAGFGWVA